MNRHPTLSLDPATSVHYRCRSTAGVKIIPLRSHKVSRTAAWRTSWHRSRALKLITCGVAALFVVPLTGHAENNAIADAERLAAARAAIKDMGEALKVALVTQIKAGGVASAIPVCQTIAPALAAEASAKHKMSVRRTALKVRNQSNKPDAFETRVLAEFVEKLGAGADPATLDHGETVTDNGKSKFRYMKAIPTAAEPCLACHGSDLKDDVKAELSKLYPEDQATGFKAGDLRGAFSVVIEP